MFQVKYEEREAFNTLRAIVADADDAVIARAIAILHSRIKTSDVTLNSVDAARKYLLLKYATLEHEVFVCLFLDIKNRLIECNEISRGTLNHATVHPREIVKAALKCNAAGVILAHNHPSGSPEPSPADNHLTRCLTDILKTVDVKVLDHIIVAGKATYSFSEHGDI